jgi:acetyl esterase/lipase
MRYAFLITLAGLLLFSNSGFSIQLDKSNRILIWSELKNEKFDKKRSELTVFTPDKSFNNGSAIIICPGGSYAYLGMKGEGYEVAKWLNSLGFTAFVLRYRVGWQGYHYPAAIQDLQRSIQLVRENANQWKINTNSVGVMGFSAGGHLVGTSAIYYSENFMEPLGIKPTVSLRPDFVVMNYAVVSMHDSIAHKKSKRYLMGDKIHSKELENKLSLEDNLHEGIPPLFIMLAKGDKTVDYRNSLYLNKKLMDKHLPAKFILYDCDGHGFGISSKKNPIASKWIYECQNWFESLGIKISHQQAINSPY